MQCDSFLFLLRRKTFKVPLIFKHLTDISENISKILITSQNHQYEIQSNVSDDVFQSFIEYLVYSKHPDIQIDNIHEYIELSTEFNILQDIIENKKKEFGEYLINLNAFFITNNQNLPYYEEQIAIKLDEYLAKYGNELMKIKINSLYNIFNHKQRKLLDHNLAYDVICQYFNKTKNYDIFILLDSLDGTKLTKNNVEESLSLCKERLNHMPNIDFSYISNAFEKQMKLEKQISDLLIEFNQYKAQNEIEKKKMHDEMKKYKKMQKKNEEEIENLNKKIESFISSYEENKNEQKLKKEAIENVVDSKLINYVSTGLSLESKGIIYQLKMQEKTPFDRLFVVSQSSRDIYNLIDPNTTDDFRTSKKSFSTINFELKEEISINGVVCFSSSEYFPKSFDISIDDQTVKSIESADQLNGENKKMTIKFNPIRGKKISFIQKSTSWDEDNTCLKLKRIEVLSDESKYSDGVFSTLIKSSPNNDPHKCPVYISANCFDFNQFMNIDSKSNICTYNIENSWFQIEFLYGKVVLNGFRINRNSKEKLKKYKIICTDDVNKEEELWTTLIEIDEKSQKDHKILDVYVFECQSPPVNFVRLVKTGPNWIIDDGYLLFYHLDLLGKYIC